jgi:hypothetical protein
VKLSTTSGATSHVMSRTTCRRTRTRSVVEVVDDEPRDVPKQPDASVGEVVDDELGDEWRDMPRHPDVWRR